MAQTLLLMVPNLYFIISGFRVPGPGPVRIRSGSGSGTSHSARALRVALRRKRNAADTSQCLKKEFLFYEFWDFGKFLKFNKT